MTNPLHDKIHQTPDDTAASLVRRVVFERARTGGWPVGSRIPSIRRLAGELGVNRGIVAYVYGHLVRSGLLRTLPGKGTFVAAPLSPATEDLRASARAHLDQAARAARLAGYSETEALALSRATVRRVYGAEGARIAFIECNPQDAKAIAADLERHVGLAVVPILLDDLLEGPAEVQAAHDLIATSFNHFAEVQAALPEIDVVGLHLVPATDSVLRLARLQPGTRIGVVCHYSTTLDLFTTTIRAYQSTIVGGALASDDPAVRSLASRSDVMVVSLFARERVASLAPHLPSLVLDLVIEPQSLGYLRSRLLELGHAGRSGPVPAQPPSSFWD